LRDSDLEIGQDVRAGIWSVPIPQFY
jgi:hypothetical protein